MYYMYVRVVVGLHVLANITSSYVGLLRSRVGTSTAQHFTRRTEEILRVRIRTQPS